MPAAAEITGHSLAALREPATRPRAVARSSRPFAAGKTHATRIPHGCTGGLPVEFLRGLEYNIRDRALTFDELIQVMDRLISAGESGNDRAAQAALHILYGYLHSPKQTSGTNLFSHHERLSNTLTSVLDLALDRAGLEPSVWTLLLDDLALVDAERAIEFGVCALMSGRYDMCLLAEEQLVRLARAHPDELMRHLGDAILNPGGGWRFRTHRITNLLVALPVATVERWLVEAGVEGARGLARHLPLPHLNEDGQPVVPELSAFVLERFADDDEVISEFCAGGHMGVAYGDLSERLESQAKLARYFFGHRLKRVRDWALFESEFARREASFWRQRDEELVQS